MAFSGSELVASQVVAKIGADTSQLKKGVQDAKDQTSGLKSFFQSSMSGMLGVVGGLLAASGIQTGIGLLVGGVKDAITSAGDFQAGLTSLETGAGESASNIGMIGKSLLQMSVDTGTTTTQLIAGLYMIESAGYHGAAGLNVLLAAAEGAKVGNADLGVVADATTTIMKDFASTGITANQAVNLLIATVASGKTHMADLAGAMSQILPTASAAKVSLTDVMGAMATMTAEGVPAADAATYLRQTLLSLDAPGSLAVSTLKSIGLSASDVSAEMQISLPGALQMITDALAKKFPVGSAAYIQALKDIAGGSKNLQGILDLTGTHLTDFKTNAGDLAGVAKKGGDGITGWAKVQDDFNQKMDKAGAVVNTLMIQFGTNLLPVIGKVVDAFSANLVPTVQHVIDAGQTAGIVIGNVVNWFIQWHEPILDAASVITLFFLPSIIRSGLEATVAAGKITGSFIASIITTGKQAVIAAAKLWMDPASLFAGLGKTGDAAATSAGEVDAMTASTDAVGASAETSAVSVDTMTASTDAVGVSAATSTLEVDALAVAEDTVGSAATTNATKMDVLASSTSAVGDASTAATGVAGGGAAAGLGILGLLTAGIALEGWVGDFTSKDVGQWIAGLFGVQQQADGTAAGLDNATTSGFGFTGALRSLYLLTNGVNSSGTFQDLFGNILQVSNYADAAAVALHNLDMEMTQFGFGGGFENPTPIGGGGAKGGGKPHAQGGPVFAGIGYPVGEEGREWFVPSQNGSIIPHGQTEQMLQPPQPPIMGGDTYNLYGPTSDQLWQQFQVLQQRKKTLYSIVR